MLHDKLSYRLGLTGLDRGHGMVNFLIKPTMSCIKRPALRSQIFSKNDAVSDTEEKRLQIVLFI